MRKDDIDPDITDDYILFDWIWTNWASKTITLTTADIGGSLVDYTKWCEGTLWSSCDPATWDLGISIFIAADYEKTIR